MAGIELAEEYFKLYGRRMLEEEFPELLPYIAVGICGSGSDCFGYDDEVSRDHDMEPGFCLLLPGEEVVDRRKAFLLERAYSKLPKEYKGLKRSLLAPVGGSRKGILRTAEFFQEKCGSADGYLTLTQWLQVPEYALAEAVNGKIFLDNYGEVTRIRERLSFYPEAVALKKLAGNLLIMGLIFIYGENFLHASADAKTVNAMTNLAAFSMYTLMGVGNLFLGITMGLFNMAGAHVGVKLAVLKGSRFIRVLFIVMSCGLLLKQIIELF